MWKLCTNLINHIIPTLQPELSLFDSPLMKNEDKISSCATAQNS